MWLSGTPPHRLWATPVSLSRPQSVGGLLPWEPPSGSGFCLYSWSYQDSLSSVYGSHVLGNCLFCVFWHQPWSGDIPTSQGMNRMWRFVLRCWSSSPFGPHSNVVLEPGRYHLKARTPSPGCVTLGKLPVLSKPQFYIHKGELIPTTLWGKHIMTFTREHIWLI